ncbi:MAG: molybdate ABC transporter substrate-binding protein [Thermoleophilia bacterium]
MGSRATAAVTATVIGTVAVLAATGCGGDAGASAGRAAGPTIFAAASLTQVLPAVDPDAVYSFAGSDQLAFQIEQGAVADVFASANPVHPDRLHAEGLVDRPVPFARNSLVVIVPSGNPGRIAAVRDLARPGVRLVIGDATVPVGAYTRTVLGRLRLRAALRNVVSEEPDVRGVVTKVVLGEADAGIAYRTDVRGQETRVRSIPIPESAQPTVTYTIATIRSSRDPAAARAFIRRLLGPEGRRALVRFGFRLPD